ncbi:MAG: VOC family protein [Xanthomonadales bacterium]|nr:VOC family protein [Xanthomonadales bacterium]
MIAYITVGTSDLNRAAGFYDALLAEFGASRMFETERMIAWTKPGGTTLVVTYPHDGKASSPGNGSMAGLAVDSPDDVHKIHDRALALGASSEGEPGLRQGGFYGAYFRDLDGNKFSVFNLVGDLPGTVRENKK